MTLTPAPGGRVTARGGTRPAAAVRPRVRVGHASHGGGHAEDPRQPRRGCSSPPPANPSSLEALPALSGPLADLGRRLRPLPSGPILAAGDDGLIQAA